MTEEEREAKRIEARDKRRLASIDRKIQYESTRVFDAIKALHAIAGDGNIPASASFNAREALVTIEYQLHGVLTDLKHD